MSIDRLTETLGGAPPKFEAAFSAAGGQVGGRISDGFAQGGGLSDPGAVGDAIAAKFNAGFEKVIGVLSQAVDRPIEVQSTVMMDGDAVAWSIGSALDGGGGGAARMRSAIAGRSNG